MPLRLNSSPTTRPPAPSSVVMGRPRLLRTALLLLLLSCFQALVSQSDEAVVHSFKLPYKMDSVVMQEKGNILLPDTSPNSAPQPFIPLLAPSPLAPFLNYSIPKLSGQCTLNFSAIEPLINKTAVDCWSSFAPFLANVVCCPQLQATLTILIGQSSRNTGMLALDSTQAHYCLSDVLQILKSQGSSEDLQHICSIRPAKLSGASCPINDINGFESAVDSSQLLAACKKVDPVNECCTQKCQNAILEAARKIALNDSGLPSMDVTHSLPEHLSRIDDCKSIVLRWLASRLEPSSAGGVLRQISNCNVNGVCPLVFPNTKGVAKDCQDRIKNRTACCNAMDNYVSHLQKQSFITNLQALNCAGLLGLKLQKMNISTNIYSFCHITLKDFSLQVGSQESGCLLPSLPSDATFDPFSGISFTCDLNDNIAAPWPSSSLASSTSTCNKTVRLPALPAATSAQLGNNGNQAKLLLLIDLLLVFTMLL